MSFLASISERECEVLPTTKIFNNIAWIAVAFQVIVSIFAVVYSIIEENYMHMYATAVIWEPYFVLLTWSATIFQECSPIPLRTSIVWLALSTFVGFIVPDTLRRSDVKPGYIFVNALILFFPFLVAFFFYFALQSMRRVFATRDEEEVREISITMVKRMLPASVVIIFLQASAIASVSGYTYDQVLSRALYGDEKEIWESVYEHFDENIVDFVSLYQDVQTTKDELTTWIESTVTGLSINISILSWALFHDVARITFDDVLHLKITFSEMVTAMLEALVVIFAVILLATDFAKFQGVGPDEFLSFLIAGSTVLFLASAWCVARRIEVNGNPYYLRDRRTRNWKVSYSSWDVASDRPRHQQKEKQVELEQQLRQVNNLLHIYMSQKQRKPGRQQHQDEVQSMPMQRTGSAFCEGSYREDCLLYLA